MFQTVQHASHPRVGVGAVLFPLLSVGRSHTLTASIHIYTVLYVWEARGSTMLDEHMYIISRLALARVYQVDIKQGRFLVPVSQSTTAPEVCFHHRPTTAAFSDRLSQ